MGVMVSRPPRLIRRKPAAALRPGTLTVPEVATGQAPAAPPVDEPDDETIRRMLEAAYT